MKHFITAVIIMVCLLSVVATDHANAQTTYTIPLQGARWSIFTIPVHIPPSNLRNITLNAMHVWINSQEWFARTYYPNRTSPIYKLIESNQESAPITLQFLNNDTWIPSYDQSNGYTHVVWRSNELTRATIQIATKEWSQTSLLQIITHELGGALGLGEPSVVNDLMNHHVTTSIPSTLDLYALHLLAIDGLADYKHPVRMVDYIPYALAQVDFPVPEFPSTVSVVFVICSLLLVTRSLGRIRK